MAEGKSGGRVATGEGREGQGGKEEREREAKKET